MINSRPQYPRKRTPRCGATRFCTGPRRHTAWANAGRNEADANAGLTVVCKRFHQFADGIDEHLRDRAKRPILQGGGADWLSRLVELHGQCFKSEMFARQ